MHESQLDVFVVSILEEMKALEISNLDITDISSFSDKMIIATATSSRHCKAIANQLIRQAKQGDIALIGTEGLNDGEWVLVDFGDIVVHIMQPRVRDFYNLEKLWSTPALVSASA